MRESKKRNEIGNHLKIREIGTGTQIVHWSISGDTCECVSGGCQIEENEPQRVG
jgi:hypothetical protein